MGISEIIQSVLASAAAGSDHPIRVLLFLGPQSSGGPEVPSYGTVLLKTVLALLAVCVLAYVVLKWGLGWIMPGRSRYLNGMRVLDRQVLEGRRCLYLVEVAERGYLLAMTDTAVTVVAEFSSAELEDLKAARAERERLAAGSGRGRSFWQALLRGRKGDPGTSPRAGRGEKTERKERGDSDSGPKEGA